MRISLLVLGMVCITGMFFMPSISAQSAELQIDQLVYEKIPHQSVITKFFGYWLKKNSKAKRTSVRPFRFERQTLPAEELQSGK